mgnify:CR=1 FL=1
MGNTDRYRIQMNLGATTRPIIGDPPILAANLRARRPRRIRRTASQLGLTALEYRRTRSLILSSLRFHYRCTLKRRHKGTRTVDRFVCLPSTSTICGLFFDVYSAYMHALWSGGSLFVRLLHSHLCNFSFSSKVLWISQLFPFFFPFHSSSWCKESIFRIPFHWWIIQLHQSHHQGKLLIGWMGLGVFVFCGILVTNYHGV